MKKMTRNAFGLLFALFFLAAGPGQWMAQAAAPVSSSAVVEETPPAGEAGGQALVTGGLDVVIAVDHTVSLPGASYAYCNMAAEMLVRLLPDDSRIAAFYFANYDSDINFTQPDVEQPVEKKSGQLKPKAEFPELFFRNSTRPTASNWYGWDRTDQREALKKALDYWSEPQSEEQRAKQGQRLIFMITDGELDLTTGIEPKLQYIAKKEEDKAKEEMKLLSEEASKSGIPIIAVYVSGSDPGENKNNIAALRKHLNHAELVESNAVEKTTWDISGKTHYVINSMADILPKHFANILGALQGKDYNSMEADPVKQQLSVDVKDVSPRNLQFILTATSSPKVVFPGGSKTYSNPDIGREPNIVIKEVIFTEAGKNAVKLTTDQYTQQVGYRHTIVQIPDKGAKSGTWSITTDVICNGSYSYGTGLMDEVRFSVANRKVLDNFHIPPFSAVEGKPIKIKCVIPNHDALPELQLFLVPLAGEAAEAIQMEKQPKNTWSVVIDSAANAQYQVRVESNALAGLSSEIHEVKVTSAKTVMIECILAVILILIAIAALVIFFLLRSKKEKAQALNNSLRNIRDEITGKVEVEKACAGQANKEAQSAQQHLHRMQVFLAGFAYLPAALPPQLATAQAAAADAETAAQKANQFYAATASTLLSAARAETNEQRMKKLAAEAASLSANPESASNYLAVASRNNNIVRQCEDFAFRCRKNDEAEKATPRKYCVEFIGPIEGFIGSGEIDGAVPSAVLMLEDVLKTKIPGILQERFADEDEQNPEPSAIPGQAHIRFFLADPPAVSASEPFYLIQEGETEAREGCDFSLEPDEHKSYGLYTRGAQIKFKITN